MIPGVIIKELKQYHDDRGWLAEIYRDDETDFRPAMSYVSVTKPGVVRGPHEHVKQSDCFVFVGPGSFSLHLWDNRHNSPTYGQYFTAEYGENNPAAVIIPPGVVHGYKCVSKIPSLVINLPDTLYAGQDKAEEVDEIRHEQDPESKFKIA